MLKVGVIGLGDIALIHVPLIQRSSQAELVAVCDCDETKKDFVEGVPFYTSYEEMLEAEDLDVVHVCLPHYLHYPVTKYVAEHGVHVLQEKPLTLNFQEGLKTLAVEDAVDTKIAICFQNRRNASVIELLNRLESEKYGRVLGIKGIVAWARPKAYYDVKPWRGTWQYAGGGTMINQSIHTLDLMQLVGKELISVKGSCEQLLDYGIEVEDTVTAHLEFKDGVTGFFMSTNANHSNDSVELKVTCEKAEFTIRNSKLYITDETHDEVELVEDAILDGPKSYYGAGHSIVFEEFYNCILNDTDDYIHVRDGLTSIKMIDAIQKSSRENRRVKMEELDNE